MIDTYAQTYTHTHIIDLVKSVRLCEAPIFRTDVYAMMTTMAGARTHVIVWIHVTSGSRVRRLIAVCERVTE